MERSKQMIRNATLEGEIFTFDCPACGTENSTNIMDYDPQYLEEIGDYENFAITCTNCRTMIGFNMQIPIFEAAEPESYFEYASDEDRNLREILRHIMWTRLPHLRERDRESEEAAYIEENGIGVPEPEPMPGMEPAPTPPEPPVPYEPPAPPPPIPYEPPEQDASQPDAPETETGGELETDREQLVEEVREAIDNAIQAEEEENKDE